MRANIYTLDGLTPEIKRQVDGGLEMLGEHVGGIDIHKSFRLNGLKRNTDGTVDAASRIGLG